MEVSLKILNKKSAIEFVRKNPFSLNDLSFEYRNDKEVVLAAVDQPECGNVLQYASEEIRRDKEVVLAAVKRCYWGGTDALMYASDELKNNKEVVLEAVRYSGYVIEYASKKLQNDREVILTSISSIHPYGMVLKFLAPHCQDDIEVVRSSVNADGLALEFASPRLRSDREIVLDAVKQNGNAIVHASPNFDDDKEIILTALVSIPDDDMGGNLWPGSTNIVLSCMSRRLREDPNVNSFAVRNHDDLLSNLLDWRILRELRQRQEENWQEKYGAMSKDRLEKWQRDVVQWQQNQKSNQYESYKVLRKEIECMPKYEIWRQQVFAKYGKRCEICGTSKGLEIHHRKSIYSIIKQNSIKDKYQAFECIQLWYVDNGSVLCHVCHEHMESSQMHNKLS